MFHLNIIDKQFNKASSPHILDLSMFTVRTLKLDKLSPTVCAKFAEEIPAVQYSTVDTS